MKTNGATKSSAVPKYDSNAVCGVISSGGGGGTPPASGGNVLKGRSTRYWDCCKVTQFTLKGFESPSFRKHFFILSHLAPGVEKHPSQTQCCRVPVTATAYCSIRM